ncbi:MAG: Ig-like domain-containing protein [Deltaproteobacteria bacterium]|nr:Ig-like domain-containing protein [Deltaproteobacteria bacterium]
MPRAFAPFAALTLVACFALPPTGLGRSSRANVVGVEVTPGSIGGGAQVQLSIDTGEPLDPSSLSSTSSTECNGTVQVSADDFATCVPGVVTIEGTKLVFTTSVALMPSTTYTIRVTTEARTAAGHPLAKEITYSFTTEADLGGDPDPGTDPGVPAPPLVGAETASGSTIRDTHVLRFVFSETMNPTSAGFTGALGSVALAVTWQQTSFANDTLVVTPSPVWPPGEALSLTVNATSAAGAAAPALTVSYNVLDGIVFVDALSGNDSASGSRAAPRKSIHAGIAQAIAIGAPVTVRVSSALQTLDSAVAPITLASNMTVRGGYNTASWDADPGSSKTTIIDETTTASTPAPVVIPAGVTQATLSGFDVRATTANLGYTAAVVCQGAATLENSVFSGGGGLASESIGVYVSGAAIATITNSTIAAALNANRTIGVRVDSTAFAQLSGNVIDLAQGTASTMSAGIYTLADGGFTATNNTIVGGKGAQSYGAYVSGTNAAVLIGNRITASTSTTSAGVNVTGPSVGAMVITQNAIEGGPGVTAYAVFLSASVATRIENNLIHGSGASVSFGVNVASGAPAIHNNTIDAGNGSGAAIGITMSGTGAPDIANNIIVSNSNPATDACVYEYDTTSDPTRLASNDFYGCATFYRDADGTGTDGVICSAPARCYSDIVEITAANTAQGGIVSGNISIAPAFQNEGGGDLSTTTLLDAGTRALDNDYRLTAVNMVATGGIDGKGTAAFVYSGDYVGATRTGNGTTGWAMGAYEKD